jgi:hypothetical protein
LAIVSVEIEGANHEYSSLPGVKDSVLDILLNLKEIVLKKTIKNFKPQIGYLRVRGPGIVRAAHLRFPPFIQSVDPDQYIATLADNGFLNMKFIIQYGNKWLSHNAFVGFSNISEQDITDKEKERTHNLTVHMDNRNTFNLHLKKRRLFFEKLKQIGIISSNLYINLLSKKAYRPTANKKYSAVNFKIKPWRTPKKLSQSILDIKLASGQRPAKKVSKKANKKDKLNNNLTMFSFLNRPKSNSNLDKSLKKRDSNQSLKWPTANPPPFVPYAFPAPLLLTK